MVRRLPDLLTRSVSATMALLLTSSPLQHTNLLVSCEVHPMCILLNFPSPDDPRPEPPAPSICMLRPVEPASTDAVSVHALPPSSERPSAPLFPLSALRVIA